MTPQTNAKQYRPEIDGLRAVAILLVLLFHFDLGITGGYVGVDVFFVISGYLITGIIVRELNEGSFSFLNFYSRRARRIAPALLITLLGTSILAYFLLLPNDFERYGLALVSQVFFASNLFHWRTSGYFGPASDQLPLLHTWSLAIEEQFYFLLPAWLFLVYRFKKNWLFVSLLILFVISAALCVVATPIYPGASFYILPTRAWELLAGSLLSFIASNKILSRRLYAEAIQGIGLFLILVAAFTYTPQTPFPGTSAFLPCLGSCLLIWGTGAQDGLIKRLLCSPPLTAIGKISYSLYLIHWPVLVFTRYWFWDYSGVVLGVSLFAISLLLAFASYFIVEQPFRNKASRLFSWGSPRILCLSSTAIIALGVFVYFRKGLPERFSPEVLQFMSVKQEENWNFEHTIEDVFNGQLTKFGDATTTPSVLVWGDSHAMALMPAINQACKQLKISGIQATHSSTPPLLNYKYLKSPYSLGQKSPEFNSAILKFAIENKVSVAFLAANWASYSTGPNFESDLERTINKLLEAKIQVVLIRDVPNHRIDVPRALARARFWHLTSPIGKSVLDHDLESELVDRAFRKYASGTISFLDPAKRLTSDGYWILEENGTSFYRDSDHLSSVGAIALLDLFLELLSPACGPQQ